jgi:hypothetical protein
VIDDEVIHRGPRHEHVENHGPTEPREYEPFITDDPLDVPDTNPVKVDAVAPPEKEELISKYTPYVLPKREAVYYAVDEIPTFKNQFDLGYKQIIKSKDHHDEEGEHDHPQASAVDDLHDTSAHTHTTPTGAATNPHQLPLDGDHYGTLAPAKSSALTPADDIWGSYLAKWKNDDSTTSYKKAAPAEPWKPASYQPFDFGKYLLRSRAPAVDDEPEAPRKAYWWEQPKASKVAGKQLAWWEQLTNGGQHLADGGPNPYPTKPAKKAVYKPYVPKSSYNSYKPTYSAGKNYGFKI